MTKFYLTTVFALVTFIGQSQTLNIPDGDFKTYLITQNLIDTDGNGESDTDIDTSNDNQIQQSEALAATYLYVTPYYNTNNEYITFSNLTGIAFFTNVTELMVNYTTIPSLDLTSLTQLKKLHLYNNTLLTSLNLNSCVALENLVCTGNALTSLNVNSCVVLKELDCNNNHITALNIANLTNLQTIHCQGNTMNSLTLTNLPALTLIDCVSNLLTTMSFSELPALELLQCYANHLQSLNLASIPSLKYLGCQDNQLTALNLTSSANLEGLSCSNNPLYTLDVSVLPNLAGLGADNTRISTINLSGLTHLENISLIGNYLTELNLNGLSNLTHVNCHSNFLTSLSINGLSNLFYLNCTNNLLPSIDLTQCPNIDSIGASNNRLTSLNISGLAHCRNLNLENNLLTSLDFSGLSSATNIDVSHNLLTSFDISNLSNVMFANCNFNLLTSVNCKNGVGEVIQLINNLNLLTVCADENEIAQLDAQLSDTVAITSYCSFTPGGIFNTITGAQKYDFNNDGCDISDPILRAMRVNIDNGTSTGATYTNNEGYYSFYTNEGSYTITPVFENPYFSVSPNSVTIDFATPGSSTQTQNFCITPVGVHYDVEIVLIPVNNARPGFDAQYKLVYKNIGNQVLSGSINLAFDDAVLDFVSANPNISNQSTNLLSWDYANLNPFESREIQLIFNVNTPMETPSVNNGDNLHYVASLNTQDETPESNTFTLNQTVIGSFDPNDKTCLEGNTITPEMVGGYLHYVIRFQNSGTAAAENVVVKDVIDTTKFDIASLQLTSTSHPQVTKILGNKVEFQFQNINLPAEIDDEPGSHGYVAFKIKTKNNLVIGNTVANKADIYFDYNFPIETNTATSTVALLGVNAFENTSVTVAPNPTKNYVHITSNGNITSLQLFDVQGRILETMTANEEQLDFDLSRKASGVYFVRIITNKGVKTEKVIRE